MKKYNQRLFYHLDDLRSDYGMSIKDFCDGVCDRRQYSRYQNSRHIISHKNVIKFYEKLGLSEIEFYYSFYNSDLSEYSELNKLYYDLINRDLKQAGKRIKELRDVEFVSQRTVDFYSFQVYYYQFLRKEVTEAHTIEKLKNLINYDQCLEKKYFNFIDVASLRLIMNIEMSVNNTRTLEFLYDVLLKSEYIYVTSETRNVLPSIYASVARQYGMLDNLNKVLEVSNNGIKYCIQINNMHLLNNLYYYKALSLYKLGNQDSAFIYARKALSVLDIKNDNETLYKLKAVIDKDFGFDSVELFNNFEFEKKGTKMS